MCSNYALADRDDVQKARRAMAISGERRGES